MLDDNIIINKIIKDNFKIQEAPNNDIKVKNDINENEKSFNQLLNLQLLIQKHSGLKELCKQKLFY